MASLVAATFWKRFPIQQLSSAVCYYSQNVLPHCKDGIIVSNGLRTTINPRYVAFNRVSRTMKVKHVDFPVGVSSYHSLSAGLLKAVDGTGACGSGTVRHKSKKRQQDRGSESDSDGDDNLDEDDFEAPTQFKVQTIHVPSLRIDAVLSKSLGLSRQRLEEIFFGPGILLNGKKVLKKGGKMDEGDYVDAIVEKTEDQLRVKRVKLLKLDSNKTTTEKFIVKVRVWKAPFLVDNENRWKPES